MSCTQPSFWEELRTSPPLGELYTLLREELRAVLLWEELPAVLLWEELRAVLLWEELHAVLLWEELRAVLLWEESHLGTYLKLIPAYRESPDSNAK